MNTGVHASFLIRVSSGSTPRSGIAGSSIPHSLLDTSPTFVPLWGCLSHPVAPFPPTMTAYESFPFCSNDIYLFSFSATAECVPLPPLGQHLPAVSLDSSRSFTSSPSIARPAEAVEPCRFCTSLEICISQSRLLSAAPLLAAQPPELLTRRQLSEDHSIHGGDGGLCGCFPLS